VFDIRPGLHDNGVPKEIRAEFQSGMIWSVVHVSRQTIELNHPIPFEYSITPRSEEAKYIIRQTDDLT
jgi:hypothetical protein